MASKLQELLFIVLILAKTYGIYHEVKAGTWTSLLKSFFYVNAVSVADRGLMNNVLMQIFVLCPQAFLIVHFTNKEDQIAFNNKSSCEAQNGAEVV